MAAILCHGCGRAFDPPAGYGRKKIQCPECGVICAVPEGSVPPLAEVKPTLTGRRVGRAAEQEEEWFRDEPIPAEPTKEPAIRPVPAMDLDDDPRGMVEEDDDDNPTPYDLREKLGPTCPQCRREMEPGATVCVKCGFNRRTRKKSARRYEAIHREWDSDRSLGQRLALVAAAQGFHVLLGVMCVLLFETAMPAIISWLPITAMVLFILGTYDHITLMRDTKGRVKIVKQWRFAFVPLEPVETNVRGFEGIVCGPWLETGILEWVVFIALLFWGVIPGLFWYWAAIHSPQYMVALALDHGHPEFYVYRGRSAVQMNEIADAISEAAGLGRLG